MKNKQAILLLFLANSISGFAQGLSMLAIPWYYIAIMGKASEFGFLYFGITVISLFWGLYAGTLIDRHDRRKLFMYLSIAGGILMLGISFSGFHMGFLPASLIGIAFASTIFIFNLHFPNLYALLQEISDPKDYAKVTSYIEIIHQTTTALSGAAAAILLTGTQGGKLTIMGFQMILGFDIQAWSLQEIFLMDGISYFLAVLVISLIRYVPIAERKPDTGSIVERLKKGFLFLKQNPMVFIFGNASYAIFVSILVVGFFLIPVYVKNHLHATADVFASGDMYFAFGAIIAGVSINWLFGKYNTVFGILITTLLTTVIYFISTIHQNVMIYYFMFLLLGFCNAGTRVLRITYIFSHVPNKVIGRTTSAFNMINVVIRSSLIGLFALPFFMEGGNVIRAFWVLGAFTFLAAMILAVYYRRLVDEPMIKEYSSTE